MSKIHTARIGNLSMGKNAPVCIQSMTNTDTADIEATYAQIIKLVNAGSELVRITVDTEKSAQAVPRIVEKVRKVSDVPIVGDFHFNGHILLEKYPQMAKALDKLRINPGNVGRGERRDENFEKIVELAVEYKKPVRIGVNGGSLDPQVLASLMDDPNNKGRSSDEIFVDAMVESALLSARLAEKVGMKPEDIILSVKHSSVPQMVRAYRKLAYSCDYLLHLGLTEAGSGLQGIVSSSMALGSLLAEGIGDTIRVSITPLAGESRTKEVEVCKEILQGLEVRNFSPKIVSCPGCGRTTGNDFADMAEKISIRIKKNASVWEKKYEKFSSLHIAVMGCIVNGLGEAQSADVGLFFPGKGEGKVATLCIGGVQKNISAGSRNELEDIFFEELEGFLQN